MRWYKLHAMKGRTPQRLSAQEFLDALELTGRLLNERGQQFEVVVIGGANLAIQNIVERLTVDVDVVSVRAHSAIEFECAKPLPEQLEGAVSGVAAIKRVPARWMNGTASADFDLGLPRGYETRLSSRVFGGLTVSLAHRSDLVAWKLQAAVDNLGIHNRHLDDLKKMQPSGDEIEAAIVWFKTVELPSSGFWANLASTLEEVGGGQ